MTRPRAYEISSPFGNFKGTVRSIVTAYNNVIENRSLTDAFKICVPGFSRLVTGKNQCGHYKNLYLVRQLGKESDNKAASTNRSMLFPAR